MFASETHAACSASESAGECTGSEPSANCTAPERTSDDSAVEPLAACTTADASVTSHGSGTEPSSACVPWENCGTGQACDPESRAWCPSNALGAEALPGHAPDLDGSQYVVAVLPTAEILVIPAARWAPDETHGPPPGPPPRARPPTRAPPRV
jgi:hypothetical protein